MNRHLLFSLLLLPAMAATGYAQQDSVQNLYFVKEGKDAIFRSQDYMPGHDAFYIYRNCVYDVDLTNKRTLSILVTDIRRDSIYYVRFGNRVNTGNKGSRDTFSLHPSQLQRLNLIGDRVFGLYVHYSLKNCRFVFVNSPEAKQFPVKYTTGYTADSSYSEQYALVAYLTAQGVDQLYEQQGKSYYYEGHPPVIATDTVKTTKPMITKNWLWFTPMERPTKINGLCLGIQTMIFDDSLIINGLNINADGLTAFVAMFAIPYLFANLSPREEEEMVPRGERQKFLHGVSISAGGLMGHMRVRGFSINGGMSGVTQMSGLHITGLQNRTDVFNGVVITGITNKAIRGRGVQIALVNSCGDLRGVQLGLWNINRKRSLPFINWQFKS